MDLEKEVNKIYIPQTREYFKEVLSSYVNHNYRSAIVILYTVCLADIVYKLQELRDMYNDSVAKNILIEIQKEQEVSTSKSSWEKLLIDNVCSKTELLDTSADIALRHLYDWRNLCAHPAFGKDSELFLPSAEQVAASMRACLDNILTKPSVFVKNIVDTMSNDINEKRNIFLGDEEVFIQYIDSKYLQRMSDKMFIKVFRAFWRFTFVLTDPICENNREINNLLLEHMFTIKEKLIIKDVEEHVESYTIKEDDQIISNAVYFFSKCPKVYAPMSSIMKLMLENNVEGKDIFILTWFMCDNMKEHLKRIKHKICVNDKIVKYFMDTYVNEGFKKQLIDYSIELAFNAMYFYQSDFVFYNYIVPFCQEMTSAQLKECIRAFDTNNQFYWNNHYHHFCVTLWDVAKCKLSVDVLGEFSNFSKEIPIEDEES